MFNTYPKSTVSQLPCVLMGGVLLCVWPSNRMAGLLHVSALVRSIEGLHLCVHSMAGGFSSERLHLGGGGLLKFFCSECLLYVLLISMVVGFLFNLLNSMAGGVFLCWFDHKFVLQQLF